MSQEIADQMAVSLARLLQNGETVFHGVASPLPMVAVLLAKKLHAPDLVYLNITGSVDPQPQCLPESTVDPVLLAGTASLFELQDVFDLAARGRLDTAFLSGIQIDRRGCINMSAVGPYNKPKVRLPGGAGSAFLMETARRVILWRTKHDPRTFVEQVSFATACGRVDRVVTPLAVFRLGPQGLQVESIHPYADPAMVRRETGFPVDIDESTPVTPSPTGEEIAALAAVDPAKVRLFEF
ncbi:MAG TPA: CoA-transferase [Spirochaetia bacterium]|nr:CoA-transferase [Spirochaetia bacterium]